MEPAKIRLSKNELQVLHERDFFIEKKIITDKIYSLLGHLLQEARLRQVFSTVSFPKETDYTTGKISKGENYMGFPYIILDFPRLFTKEEIVAIRTMVWWGNFISSTLIISGSLFKHAKKATLNSQTLLKQNDVWLCIHETPWEHHFEKENLIPINEISQSTMGKILDRNNFLKLSRKISIKKINKLMEFGLESFTLYAKMLNSSR